MNIDKNTLFRLESGGAMIRIYTFHFMDVPEDANLEQEAHGD